MRLRSLFFPVALAFSILFSASGEPAWADSSHARVIRLSLVQGQVRFTREFHNDSLSDQKAVWEDAVLNLPIRQSYALATDNGRAEVEFENGAMAFLAENTVLEFYDLSLNDGAKTTRLILRQGTASFYVNPASDDYFSVTGGDFTVEASARASFRMDNFDDGSVVNVSKGHVSVLRKEHTTLLAKGQSFSIRANDDSSLTVGREADTDDFDRWVTSREDSVLSATNAAQQYVNSPNYTAGMADLYTYGSWYPVAGYGNCWRPYGVGLGWSPFDNGGWYMDPSFGWSFVGYQPWGWLPYHYGGWVFDPVFGWLWSPFGFGFAGFGGGFVPFRPVTGVFVRSRTGLLGLVPAHPLDARGKAPINLSKGVFSVNGGAVSPQVQSVDEAQKWKAMKSAPRDALRSNVTVATAAPLRVSRTIVTTNPASRMTGTQRNPSIVYDPQERRFVNSNSAQPSATPPSAVMTGTQKSQTQNPQTQNAQNPNVQRQNTPNPNTMDRERAAGRAGASGVPAPGNATVRNQGVPAAGTRSAAPARTAAAPPPAPRAPAGGSARGGSTWSGAGSGTRSSSPAPRAPSAPSAPAPRATSAPSAGRPH